MPDMVGGLRDRLIAESVYQTLHDGLDALGWFDPGRWHSPINMVPAQIPDDQEIPLNTLTVSGESMTPTEAELGSSLQEGQRTFFADFYAEDDDVGRHLNGDVRDILLGKMPVIGRTRPIVEVWDDTLATPVVVFIVEILDVVDDHAHGFTKPAQRHWFSCRFDVADQW